MKKILILNGPNLQLLGIREPDIYGKGTYADLVEKIKAKANEWNMEVEFLQSNHEGVLLDAIGNAYGKMDGIILNPAAYTHTSIALADAIKAVGIPTVEVHISDVTKREDFRGVSFIRPHCVKTIMGKGFDGYIEALEFLKDLA